MNVIRSQIEKLSLLKDLNANEQQKNVGAAEHKGFSQFLERLEEGVLKAADTDAASLKPDNNRTDTGKRKISKQNKPDAGKRTGAKGADRKNSAARGVGKTETEDLSKANEIKAEETTLAESGPDGVTDTKKEAVSQETVVAAMAEVLDIPSALLAEILHMLNLTPEDLTDRDNLILVMQAVYDAETPVELLNVPDISTMMETIEALASSGDFAGLPTEGTAKTQLPEISRPQANASIEISTGEGQTASMTDEFIQLGAVQEPEPTAGENAAEGDAKAGNESANASNSGTGGEIQTGGDQEASLLAGVEFDGAMMNAAPGTGTENNTVSIARSEVLRSVNPQEIVSQIAEKIKVDVKAETAEIKMTLSPENLGDVSLKVSTENGIVTAQFIAESQRVKEIIESNFSQLKDALNEQGIDVSGLSVFVRQEEKDSQQMSQFLKERSKSQLRISKIINGISQEEAGVLPEKLDVSKVYKNNVNYEA